MSEGSQIFLARELRVYQRIDRFFASLLLFEWLASVVLALVLSPRAWSGSESSIHPHVWQAGLLGGLFVAAPLLLLPRHSGQWIVRATVAVAQMLMSGLLIHLTEGRLETHFHVFGSLAFLSLYGDCRVVLIASLVTALDHALRGWLFPLSMYGLSQVSPWRWAEHTGWVLFCDAFLIWGLQRARQDRREAADYLAQLEKSSQLMERQVEQRTQQLKFQKRRFVSAFENAPIGMALVAADGKVEKVNLQLCSILQYSQEQLSELNLHDLLANSHWQQGEEIEVPMRRRDGSEAWVLFKASRQPEIRGTESTYVAQIVDMSGRRQSELALREAQKLESIGLLAGGIAHEINTPVQYISDNLRFLKESFGELIDLYRGPSNADLDFLREEIPKAIEQSLEGAVRVATIVRSIKEYSHRSQEDRESIDLHRVLQNTIEVSRNEWKYCARIETNFDSPSFQVLGNRNELCQVFLNLLVNSAHAIQEKGEPDRMGVIRISTRSTGQSVCVEVEDSGAGIPEDVQTKVFAPFFTTKGVGQGTGQGLSICHSVVRKHQGSITFQSQPGRGTTFVIELPLCEAA